MGDIADATINGLLCEQCGSYIDGDEPGYPRNCGCETVDELDVFRKPNDEDRADLADLSKWLADERD